MASFFEHIGSEVESVADAAALASKIAAEAAQVAAEASANAAASSASDASNSEATVTSSQNAAAASATASAASAATSTTKAVESAASASTATTKASESAASAATSTSQASTAATQASTSTSQATISTTKATEAAASAANAANSATSADTAKTAAEQAETNAETAETNAASSASSASTSASNASTSATAASGSASAASTSEANTASSVSAAATSATNAATSETNSASSATSASNSAATATTQATTATTKATESAASQATSTAQATISTTKASEAAASAATATTKASEAAASAASTNALIDPTVLKVDATNNRIGINDTTPSVSLDAGSNTDAIAVPVGTTAQRPADGAGRFRYNSTTQAFEGYTTEWGSIAGGGGTNTFTTDSFTANGSTTAYALSQVVSSEGSLLVFIDGVFQTQDAYAIATASGTTTLTFSAAPANARKIVVYSVAAAVSGSNLNIDSMTGDGSDVTLTLSIAPVTINNTIVTIDGVYQAKANYSISGTTLTFSTAPPTGSAVEVMTFTQTDINVPVDGTITSAKLSGALTTPSDLTVTGAFTSLGIDDNATSTAITIDSSENVGIGIAPSKKLTVFGTGVGNATVQIEGEGGADPYINFLTNNAQHWSLGVDDSDADKFKLSEHSALGTNDYLTVDVSGNLLVGITSAYTGGKLSVNGGIVQPSGAQNVIGVYGTSGLQMIGVTGGDNVIGTMGANEPLVLRTGSAERIRIDGGTGSVGIGASSISSWTKLQVAGTAGAQTGAAQALYLTSPSTTANEGVGIRMSAASGSHEAVGIIGMVNNASGNAGSMTFHTYNGGADIPERMRISAEGYVTTPSRPAFKAGRSGNYTPSQNTAIVFNDASSAQHFNIGGHYSTSSGRFTCPVAGLYFFHTVVIYGPSLPEGQNMADAFSILRNGALVAYAHRRAEYINGTTGSGGYFVEHATVVLNCAANQYVEVNSKAFPVHGNTHYTYFTGYLIG